MPRKTGRLDYPSRTRPAPSANSCPGWCIPVTCNRVEPHRSHRQRRWSGTALATSPAASRIVEGTSGVVTAGIHATGTPLTTLPHASPFACQQERAGASIGRSYPCGWGAPAVIAGSRGARPSLRARKRASPSSGVRRSPRTKSRRGRKAAGRADRSAASVPFGVRLTGQPPIRA